MDSTNSIAIATKFHWCPENQETILKMKFFILFSWLVCSDHANVLRWMPWDFTDDIEN